MGPKALLAWTIGAALGLTASVSHSMCATPTPVVAPAGGATLPPNPRLYLFMPRTWAARSGSDGEPTVRVSGDHAVTFQVREVARTPGLVVSEIVVESRSARHLHVELTAPPMRYDTAFVRSREYTIDPAWAVSPALEVKIVEGKRLQSAWTCSHTDVLSMVPSVDAPVYRVEWADSASEYAAGHRKFTWLPRHPDQFWGLEPSARPQVDPGHPNCMASNLPDTARVGELTFVGVSAIFPDGTVIPASSEPYVAPGEKDVFGSVGPRSERAVATSSPAIAIDPLALVLTALVGFVVGVLGGLWPWRRRPTIRTSTS